MQEIGSKAGLRFQFEWQAKKPARCKTAARATWGKCLLWLGDELVWGEPQAPVEWDWVQLLEFLAGAWNWLVYEEIYPIPIAPNNPAKMWTEAARRWEQMADDSALEEQTVLYEFESVHNLAKGLAGIHLPPLFLLRQGRNFWIETQETSVLRPAAETLDTLKQAGNLLHARLQSLSDRHSIAAQQLWNKAEDTKTVSPLLEIVTGLPGHLLKNLSAWLPEIQTEADITELHVAARMTGNFQLDSIQQVLQAIERIPPGKTSVLDDLSREAAQVLANCSDKKFYEQGYVLADWLRQKLDMENNAKTDPRALLDSWQIESKDITGLDENLEAVACWGKQHGPAVLVNREGRYSRNPAGRNAALAHEICHLLADRHGALPLVEVLGGRVPKGTEQRANAFAAEFLLPRSQAAVAAKDFTRQEAPLLQQLGRQYGVSHHVAANQVLNSAARSGLDDNVRTFLERYRRDLWL